MPSRLSAPVTEAQIRGVVASTKLVTSAARWVSKSNSAWAGADWPIRHELSGLNLRLVATVNVRMPQKHAASILWNDVRVAGVCVSTPHLNKHTDFERFDWGGHEHVWTDACNGSWCRPVAPAPMSIHETVRVLCDSFGVTFQATWSDPPLEFQTGVVAL